MSDLIKRTGRVSACGLYRYRLTRQWAEGDMLPFVMLNPSTADAYVDDPTIRRCMGFARREGYAGILVVNRFAFRSKDPDALKTVEDPFGPDNLAALSEVAHWSAQSGNPIVCGWGANTPFHPADAFLISMKARAARLVCLGRTKDGSPRHPLYVRADQPLVPFA